MAFLESWFVSYFLCTECMGESIGGENKERKGTFQTQLPLHHGLRLILCKCAAHDLFLYTPVLDKICDICDTRQLQERLLSGGFVSATLKKNITKTQYIDSTVYERNQHCRNISTASLNINILLEQLRVFDVLVSGALTCSKSL